MLTRIQAMNYRCLKRVDQALSNFSVLVGGNGVGKSTFLDVLSLLREIASQPRDSVVSALHARSVNFDQLLFDHGMAYFEVAVEAGIPEPVAARINGLGSHGVVRFQIRIGYSGNDRTRISVLSEKLLTRRSPANGPWINLGTRRSDGTVPEVNSDTILEADGFSITDDLDQGFSVVHRTEGIATFQYEVRPEPQSAGYSKFHLAGASSALANLPEDPEHFPVATWFRRYLTEFLVKLAFEPENLRRPTPIGFANAVGTGFLNIPEVVATLSSNEKVRFADWISHLRVALPDLEKITVNERPEDRQRYLVVHYSNDRAVPSWLVSDGTLRLIGLTLPAYALDNGSVFLIEEPENCIHPLAIEVVMQSLSSMYESQVFVTTHSPAILSLATPQNILCFSKSTEDGTMIVRGDLHPRMSAWKGTVDLGTLLASGILG